MQYLISQKNILQILPNIYLFIFLLKNNKDMLMEKEMTSNPSM
jgi:hypothetical protein